MTPRAAPRARYAGGRAPDAYLRANAALLAGAPDVPDDAPGDLADAMRRRAPGCLFVVPVPADWAALDAAAAIREMEDLRRDGVLTPLRGGRPTDLARGLRPEARARVKERCPALRALLAAVAPPLRDAGLFVRAVKLDDPRRSTTSPRTPDAAAEHFHYDNAPASVDDDPGPLYQYDLNAGRAPRQLRVLPYARDDVLASLAPEDGRALPLGRALERFLAADPRPVVEEVIVEQGHVAIFDGRAWAHDGAKADVDALARGEWAPSPEKDLALALDDAHAEHTRRYYHPELDLLDDPATPTYWKDMGLA